MLRGPVGCTVERSILFSLAIPQTAGVVLILSSRGWDGGGVEVVEGVGVLLFLHSAKARSTACQCLPFHPPYNAAHALVHPASK